ncbi:hypothetical protein [Amycolatopsis sp. cg13]|uniref:hypothetical protein n=1 Tax=Amycolatopsis sp. cg13 TaxID=3238807 RepID=UPI0035256A56
MHVDNVEIAQQQVRLLFAGENSEDRPNVIFLRGNVFGRDWGIRRRILHSVLASLSLVH